jgi:hypothetical protein
MKKFIFLLLSVVLLHACGGAGTDYSQPPVVSFVGIVDLISANDEFDGFNATHILHKKNGNDLPIRSLAINLSDERYFGNLLNVTGAMDDLDGVFEVQGVTVLEVLSPVKKNDPIEEDDDDEDDSEPGGNKIVDDIDDSFDDVIDEVESLLPSIDMTLTSFESLPYFFRGRYPSNWYYAGSLPVSEGVLHHYGFSDEPVTRENEVLSLDVINSSLMRSGNTILIDGREFIVEELGADYFVYTSVGGRYYRVSGPTEYKDLILNMAVGIEPFETENQ